MGAEGHRTRRPVDSWSCEMALRTGREVPHRATTEDCTSSCHTAQVDRDCNRRYTDLVVLHRPTKMASDGIRDTNELASAIPLENETWWWTRAGSGRPFFRAAMTAVFRALRRFPNQELSFVSASPP